MNIFLQIIAFSSLAFIIGLMVGAAMASAKNEDLQTEVDSLSSLYECTKSREQALMEKHAKLERTARSLGEEVLKLQIALSKATGQRPVNPSKPGL